MQPSSSMHISPRRVRRRQYRAGLPPRRGAATVEMALVLPLFLLFVFGVFEYGRFAMVRNLVENATREGCRRAVVNTDVNDNSSNYSTAQITAVVQNALAGQSLSDIKIDVYHTGANGDKINDGWASATYQEGVAVEVSGNYQPILIGWVLKSGVPVKSKSVMNSEGN